jgi:hypothetical protein
MTRKIRNKLSKIKILFTFIILSYKISTQKSFFSFLSKDPKKTKGLKYQTDEKTQKVISDSINLTSAKKSKSRIKGFIELYKTILLNHKSFKKYIDQNLKKLEHLFLEIDKEVKFYKTEIVKHNSLLEPIKHLLNESIKEKNFLQRYKYSAGATPDLISVIQMVDERVETLTELMPMDIPEKDIVNDIKFKWQEKVLTQAKEIIKAIFKDMNLLNRVVDFLKNDVKEIDLQTMVKPILKPFIDFYGKRVVEEWHGSLEELKDFQNKIWVPLDTYTIVYFSVRDSIMKTVINSVKPFMNSYKPL